MLTSLVSAYLMMEVTDPLCELPGVGDGGRQEDVVDVIGEQDDGLFPHNPSLWGRKLIIQNITTITTPRSGNKNNESRKINC